jgi:N-acetylmuramoyl-L-alanine amidase
MPVPTLCPFADYRPIPCNTGGPMAENIGLVVHVQVGTGSLFGWFSNPAAEVSAHFWIDLDGTLEQYVEAGTTAWAEVEGNSSYLSVETCGFPEDPLTDEQCATLAKLIAWGHESYGWPLELVNHGGHGVTTHSFYPSGLPDPAYGDHPCPGLIRLAQLPSVLAAAIALVNPVTPEVSMGQYLKSGVFKDGVFSATPVTYYEQVVYQGATHYRPYTNALDVAQIPASWWVEDNAHGGLLNRFPVIPVTVVASYGTTEWGADPAPPVKLETGSPVEPLLVPPDMAPPTPTPVTSTDEAATPAGPVPYNVDDDEPPELPSGVTP